ncbi:MAG: hypothetical protein ROR55_19845 [Devosia sp.]
MKMYRLTVAADVRCYKTVRFEADSKLEAVQAALKVIEEMEPGTNAVSGLQPDCIQGDRAIVELTNLSDQRSVDEATSFWYLDEGENQDEALADRYRRSLTEIYHIAKENMHIPTGSLGRVMMIADGALRQTVVSSTI